MPILNADYSNLDYETMAKVIGLKPKHIPMLIESFLEESSSILTLLSEAIEQNNFTIIKEQAHSIKGSAGNLRFNELYEMAKEMEHSAQNSDSSFDYKVYLETIKSIISTIK